VAWLLVLREWGVFGVGTAAAAAMVLLDEDVASLPWFDSFSQEPLTDSFGNFYIPKSVNNLLKAWLLILLALLMSLRVNNLASAS
jgi:hypothetical protein